MKKQLTFFTSLLAALALSATAYAAATDVKFQVRNETDGLGDPTVNSAFAESNYVYAATDYGLAISSNAAKKYGFTNYYRDLSSHLVFGVYAKGSNVYVATKKGLDKSSNYGSTFTAVPDLNGKHIYKVFTYGNDVYAATKNGLYVSTDKGNNFPDKYLEHYHVHNVFADGSHVYAATADGLSTDFAAPNPAGLPSKYVNDVYAFGNKVYVATDNGLSLSNDGGSSYYKTVLPGDYVNSVYVLHPSYRQGKNIILAATTSGLKVSLDDGNDFATVTTSGLPTSDLNQVYAKGSGSTLYVATNGGGLAVGTLRDFVPRTTADGLGADKLHAIVAKGKDIYVATNDGLSISNNGGDQFTNTKFAPGASDNVYGVAVTGLGSGTPNIYAATHQGVEVKANGASNFTLVTAGLDSPIAKAIAAISNTSTGQDDVYVGTKSGLSKSTDSGSTFTPDNTFNNNEVYGIHAVGSYVYVASEDGLFKNYQGGTFSPVYTSEEVYGVYADDNGKKVYIATNTGLKVNNNYGSGSWTAVNEFNGKKMRSVFAKGELIYGGTKNYGIGINTDYDNAHYVYGLDSNTSKTINDIAIDGDILYVATDNGLAIGPS